MRRCKEAKVKKESMKDDSDIIEEIMKADEEKSKNKKVQTDKVISIKKNKSRNEYDDLILEAE